LLVERESRTGKNAKPDSTTSIKCTILLMQALAAGMVFKLIGGNLDGVEGRSIRVAGCVEVRLGDEPEEAYAGFKGISRNFSSLQPSSSLFFRRRTRKHQIWSADYTKMSPAQ
jgi:hypothetical protein